MALRIEVQRADTGSGSRSGDVRLRALLVNDGYQPVVVSRNAFVGPNVSSEPGAPRPESVEASFGGPEERLTLQPFTFYGRERTFEGLGAGETIVTAYYRPPGGDPEIVVSRPIRVG